jgi:hypothetical protein
VKGRGRSLYAAVFASGVAWALHAGIDWDWEMPAVTFWLFALAGMTLAARRGGSPLQPPSRLMRVVLALGCLVVAVTPALVFASQTSLNRAVAGLGRDDCATAIDSALTSLSAVNVRPEPLEVLGYCDSRLGEHALAVRSMESAVRRDPESWELRYGLALVMAAAGRDPVPAAEAAQRRNPLEPLTEDLVRRLRAAGPDGWREEGRASPLPFEFE